VDPDFAAAYEELKQKQGKEPGSQLPVPASPSAQELER
jgi:hypothetical protein